MAPYRPRLFIDCAFVDFTKQPTGIPRVVLKYIEIGYAWGSHNNIEVIPVVATAQSLVICRPVPGADPPLSLLDRVRASQTPSIHRTITNYAKRTFRYFKNIVHHIVFLIAAIVPIPPIKWTATWIDDSLETITRQFEAKDVDELDPIKYVPRKGDILFAPAYWHDVDPRVYAALNAKGLIVVPLVHDVLPIAFEHFYPSPWRYVFGDNVRKAFGYASAFFCVSNLTKSMLLEFSYRQKTRQRPMMTAYNGFEPLVSDVAIDQLKSGDAKPLLGNARFHEILEGNPLVMIGSVEPKKGHIPVIKCLEAMWVAGYARSLLIVGRTGWMERDVVAAIQGSLYHGKKLFWFTNIDDYDLAMAYSHCHALIFSSIAEGFGIPMIEASYYGKPTIAYDTQIVREILGDRALLFSSAAQFVQQLVDLEEAACYTAACAAAKSIPWPSWSNYTPAVFDALLNFARTGEGLPDQVAATSPSRALAVVPSAPPVPSAAD